VRDRKRREGCEVKEKKGRGGKGKEGGIGRVRANNERRKGDKYCGECGEDKAGRWMGYGWGGRENSGGGGDRGGSQKKIGV